MLVLIAAVGNQNQIGLEGKMTWRNKEDLQFFKEMTLNNKVVFGRKTYLEMPKLTGREIYIVSKKSNELNTITDFDSFLVQHKNDDELFFIAGGQQIYEQALKYCNILLISRINYDGNADTFFPYFCKSMYELITYTMNTFTLEVYIRKDYNNEYDRNNR
ncbi:MAG: dihydrofolate reductase [Erysipelothrix sp.]|nr:dihydrofolate reductase [Erysipelothrix sp.]